jgi:hypothetical protein
MREYYTCPCRFLPE